MEERCPDDDLLAAFAERRLATDKASGLTAHLERCATCRQVVAALARAMVPSEATSGAAIQTPPSPRRIGRYEVTRVIGAGGMGIVYAAFDPQLGRQVALKVTRPVFARVEGVGLTAEERDRLQERLLAEARALARLNDPFVITVHDVGAVEGEEGAIFVAMELVDGVDLREWLSHDRPWREVLRVFLAAGRGLAAAHGQGVIHRDFKPDNVLVGHDGRVRVGDFGLARAREPLSSLKTVPGQVLGTPAYMAPEQLMGDEVGPAADLFSFGVALFEGLYRRRPFEGETLPRLLAAIAEQRVALPSSTKVPARLGKVVLEALHARPGERPARLGDFLAMLEQAARPRTLRWIGIGAAAAVAVALAIAGVAATPSQKPERRPAPPEPTPVVAAPVVTAPPPARAVPSPPEPSPQKPTHLANPGGGFDCHCDRFTLNQLQPHHKQTMAELERTFRQGRPERGPLLTRLRMEAAGVARTYRTPDSDSDDPPGVDRHCLYRFLLLVELRYPGDLAERFLRADLVLPLDRRHRALLVDRARALARRHPGAEAIALKHRLADLLACQERPVNRRADGLGTNTLAVCAPVWQAAMEAIHPP